MLQRILIIWWWAQDAISGKPLGGLRSSGWYQFRKTNIKKRCECCGRKGTLLKPLQLHHIKPFHLHPELELDPDNVITLCNECHLREGHNMNYKSFNVDVRKTAAEHLERIENSP